MKAVTNIVIELPEDIPRALESELGRGAKTDVGL